MKLFTRMIISWLAVLADGVTLMFNMGPWFFFGALLLSDLLRTRFEPRIPRTVGRRRTWILLPLALLYLALGFWLDVPESATHPLHIGGGIGFAAAVVWLVRDDIKIYRQLQDPHAAE